MLTSEHIWNTWLFFETRHKLEEEALSQKNFMKSNNEVASDKEIRSWFPVASGEAGGGGAAAPQFLADQLTLPQPGGHIMPTTLLRATPDFQTLGRCVTVREIHFT